MQSNIHQRHTMSLYLLGYMQHERCLPTRHNDASTTPHGTMGKVKNGSKAHLDVISSRCWSVVLGRQNHEPNVIYMWPNDQRHQES